MKTGRPDYYIPSPMTVSQDVKKVFVNVCRRLAKMLQEHPGDLNFATDTWTSPNHKAFVAITVHFEIKGVLMHLLLDLVEVAESHSSTMLAAEFVNVLKEFGISDKVSNWALNYDKKLTSPVQILGVTCDNASPNDTMIAELNKLIHDFPGEPNYAWCFNHTVALIAKRVVRQFDITGDDNMEEMDDEL